MPIPQAHAILRHTGRWGVAARYLAATALVGVAALVRWALDPWLENANYLLFLTAVSLSAILFERGSGVWTTVLGATIASYVFAEPRFSFDIGARGVVPLLTFVVAGLLVSSAAEAMRALADRLLASDQEKDVLYRELHHRMRNNLQIIGTTITVQMLRSTGAEARDALQAVADRITGIARLDQLLFRPGLGEIIDAGEYLEQLVRDIAVSLVGQRSVSITCDAQPHPISRDLAETLGIAINELATNALKYAFPDGASGTLSIRFGVDASDYVLQVRDDGTGCPATAASGTGWRLITAMLGRHRGSMVIEEGHPGCRATIRVPIGEPPRLPP